MRDLRDPRNELDPAVQRYVDLYEFAPIAYVAFDRSGRIQDVNRATCDLLNRKREYLVGSPFSLSVLPAELDLFLRHLARCRAGDSRVESNLRLKKHDGEPLSVVLSSTPTTSFIREGAQLFQTAIVDITERERAERALRQSEERYRSLFDLVPVAVYACDEDGVILEYNRRAVDLWGCEPGRNGSTPKFCGSYKIYYPDERPMSHETCPMARALRGEKLSPEDLEIIVEKPDGERRHVIPAPQILRDERGRIVGAINCLYDITERKQIEDAAQRLQETSTLLIQGGDVDALYKHILDTAIALMRSDMGSLQVFHPDRGELRLLAWKGFDPKSAAFWKWVRPASGSTCGMALRTRRRVIASDVETCKFMAGTKDLDAYRKSGICAVQSTPLISRSGSVVGMISTHWRKLHQPAQRELHLFDVLARQAADLIERKQAEDELQRSKDLLENLVQQRTKALRFANTELENEITRRKGLEGQILEISDREQERLGQELHDGLCQQLTAIGFLVRATALRLKDHRVVQTEDLERIAQLINSSVMDARNIARGLHKEEIEAPEFPAALQDLVHRKIWKTPCRLDLKTEVNIEDDKVASQLYRILREALINANKHARATQIILEVRRGRSELVFSVADNGVGLSRKPKVGQGLGFHIMQYRARSIGARLEFDSPKKGGSRVACYLPLS